MAYKTILAFLDPALRPDECTRVAAQLAMENEAHLIGLATTGMSPLLMVGSGIDPASPPLAEAFGALRSERLAMLDAFEHQVRMAGVASFERRLIEEEAGYGLVQHGRYCDLLVMGQTRGPGQGSGLRKDVPEYVLLNGTRPVLLVPATGSFGNVGRHAAVAWNGSREASRALTSALSLLKRAGKVSVVLANPGTEGVPGADVGLYLARHGIAVEVLTHFGDNAEQALLDALAACQADLLVMGAYGHARLREFLLGGATRTMLRRMPVPVWMAH
jgi:nucleotide-binding universal stress UspA family protein